MKAKNTSTYQIHHVTLFQQLQTNPNAETLIKAYNIELVRYLCLHPAEVDRYWNSIKIAKRARCKFNEPKMIAERKRV